MKLPRDLSGAELVKGLQKVGYTITRQKGSHIRLTTQRNGEHHITVPKHDPLRGCSKRLNSHNVSRCKMP